MRPANATGEISALSKEGDTKHHWNKDDPAEVEVAKEVFASYKRQGYAAARMNPGGEAGEMIREFDPTAESLLMIPPIAGG